MGFLSSEIDYVFEDDVGCPHVVTVYYTFLPGSPKRRHGHPDDWHDAEVSEIEIDGARWTNTGEPLTKEELELLLGDYEESIYRKIAKAENKKDG